MVTLEGTLALLAPGFEMVEETRALAGPLLGGLVAPSSLQEAATGELLALLPVLRRLPRRLDRITTSLERGTLGGNVRLLADERDIRFAASVINRAVLAFAGASLGMMSVILLAIHGGPALLPRTTPLGGTSVFRLLGYLGLFFAVVLILRVVIAIAREGIGPREGDRRARH